LLVVSVEVTIRLLSETFSPADMLDT